MAALTRTIGAVMATVAVLRAVDACAPGIMSSPDWIFKQQYWLKSDELMQKCAKERAVLPQARFVDLTGMAAYEPNDYVCRHYCDNALTNQAELADVKCTAELSPQVRYVVASAKVNGTSVSMHCECRDLLYQPLCGSKPLTLCETLNQLYECVGVDNLEWNARAPTECRR